MHRFTFTEHIIRFSFIIVNAIGFEFTIGDEGNVQKWQ